MSKKFSEETLLIHKYFRKAYRRIKKTGRSASEVGLTETCQYRGPNGAACAVGALIKDKCYSTEMEGRTVQDLTPTRGRWNAGSDLKDQAIAAALNGSGIKATRRIHAFLMSLQFAHDGANDTEYALRRMRIVGRAYRVPNIKEEPGTKSKKGAK